MLVYRVCCYLGFVTVFLYAVAFLADTAVPRTVDAGGPSRSSGVAVLVDAVLLGLFAAQHSVMARPAFKRWWTTIVPAAAERATYVLLTSVVLAVALWEWRPIPSVVWHVPSPAARAVVWAVYGLGWLWVLLMSFAIDHLDFFGLRRVPPAFALPWPYRLVRHPMMIGFFVAFLATPTMTLGHLLFAGLGCSYILVGVRLEEQDLAAELPEYDAYAAATPRFVPRLALRRHSSRVVASPSSSEAR